jgi:DNA topoisomerase-2
LNYIRAKLDNAAELPIIRPYAKGFKGSIKLKEDGTGYVTLGCIKVIDDRTVVIDELPLGCWTSTYKEKLVKMQQKGIITDFVENHTTSDVSFTVFLRPFTLRRLVQSGLESSFDLSSYISTNNMHAFDTKGKMRKFHSAEAIAEAFFPVRLELYNDRKSVLEAEMKYHATTLRNKANFISAVTAGNVDLMSGRQSRAATSTRLAELGFAKKSELHAIRNDNAPYKRNTQTQSFPDQVEEVQEITIDSEFDYLLNMPLSSLTSEKISELQEQAQKVEEDFRRIQSTKAADLWREDLDKIEPLL